MTKSDTAFLSSSDLLTALALLTRLPLPEVAHTRGAEAAWAYPLVGFIVGGLAAITGGAAMAMGLPAPLAALLSLAALTMTTGALHEDGLADTADGLWGGWTRERRLEIMKDSRIGAYGVIALFFSFSARWAAIWMCFEAGFGTIALILSATLSRAAMSAVMAGLPHARDAGLSRSVGTVAARTALMACAIAGLVALALTGMAGILLVIWAGIGAGAVAFVAKRKIGGQTGDILGATQQIVEIAVLFSLLA